MQEPVLRPSEAPLADPLPYIDAKFYRRASRRSAPLWVVIHATHGAEGHGKARQGARELADIPAGALASKRRSAHAFVDTGEVVQCVPWACEAWHCGRTGNRYGEGIELCGRADQTLEQWLDAKSLPMLAIAAQLVRWRCAVNSLPLEWLTKEDLQHFKRGITSHAEVSRAFRESSHWDPGPAFPIAAFVDAVRLAVPSTAAV
ncbi:MAG TPA: peptidoglycan recognition family protein [Polyangiales bacterium]|nr:peptidoglycan recognition family protein [Polyangiales bacterium]